MSDDGFGGGGDDYDYESGPGCVTKKKINHPLYYIKHAILDLDLMMEHSCVSFLVVWNYEYLVGGSQCRTKAMTFLQTNSRTAKLLMKRGVRTLCVPVKTV
jgi:hypothetical protein